MRKRDNLATIALMCLSFLAPFNIFFPNHLSIKYKRTIFAEDKLHSAICKKLTLRSFALSLQRKNLKNNIIINNIQI